MSYASPFGRLDADHDSVAHTLCLSRTHCVSAPEETLAEYHQAAVAAIERSAPQPAFFLARQLAELTLKALHTSPYRFTHRLDQLLESLAEAGDDLLAGGSEENDLVAFIRDLDACDSAGDEGRYPTTRNGTPALANVCCADPALLRALVDRLHTYAQTRLALRQGAATP
ncbi:hypothetical protein SAMN06297387_1283 [Streptomyces zhaozhouensis]|uniref:HEPN domain-containing protein n=1 Tax=Streptomyces zhaozhouensis TaxID=1300267 RepID=A0A286E7P7_9ACTN|nr:hypothetical protein [Streptomyces zhaozhouensis]SOD66932.1 hypothetical protein SAMN06297387_1283 [Streptomyces zhaozhouensis]